jgi:hypothetical protein
MAIDRIAYEVVGTVLIKEAAQALLELVDMPEGTYFNPEEASKILQEKFDAPSLTVGKAWNQWLGKTAAYYISVERLEGGNFIDEVDEPGIFGLNTRVDEASNAERSELNRVLRGLGQEMWQLQCFVAFSII